MSNPFYDLYNAMKRSEKEVLISGSGSTPQGKNEKNRSGQSYLYKRHGMESEVIEIRLKKKVSGSFLNQALQTSIKRYPYFNTRLVERDYCRREANAMIGLFDKLDSLRSYEEKQKIISFYEGMTLNTYIISYLGTFRLGAHEKQIDSIHLYNSGTTGLGINMICCGDSFILDFKQNFSSNKYVRTFCAQLEQLGAECRVSDAIPFITPGDSIIKRETESVVPAI